MNNRYLILPILFSIVMCFGCKDKLTTGKAEKLIVESQRLPKDVGIDIKYGMITRSINSLPPFYFILQECKMLTIENLGKSRDFIPSYLFRVTLTAEGKKYVVKENHTPVQDGDTGEFTYNSTFKIAELHFEKIQDIHEIPSWNAADIRYVVRYKNFTPFWNYVSAPSSRKADTVSIRTISAIKTDNGWTILKK